MEENSLAKAVNTVIVGGGPASLILSYILHGRVPHYTGGHPDHILDHNLRHQPNLLKISPDVCAHFASSLRYSTQALPLNTLLDTLIRPNADVEYDPKPCIEWRAQPSRAVDHLVLTSADAPGGQWAQDPIDASWNIATLSYAEMLSLPGYSYAEHYEQYHRKPLPEFERPSRADISSYFAAYPQAVGISRSVICRAEVRDVVRSEDGFYIGSHGIVCQNLVLASGIFSYRIPPPKELSILSLLRDINKPLLVVGSGFSAADVIISSAPQTKILHVYRWAPDTSPSPLKGCHHQAYPEYAGVYRQMKLAAISSAKSRSVASPMARQTSNPFFTQRDWSSMYQGLPNAKVLAVSPMRQCAEVELLAETGEVIRRVVGNFAYAVGRRGSLDYLSEPLRQEVLSHCATSDRLVSGRTLRSKAKTSFELAPHVFVVGSLAGDSLIRHAFGGCVSVAGMLMGEIPEEPPATASCSYATSGACE